MAFGPDGHLYVGSYFSDAILRFDKDDASPAEFVAVGSGGLDAPFDLAFEDHDNDGTADLFVTSRVTEEVLRYSGSDGSFLEAYVSSANGGLSNPTDLLFTPDGNLLVASTGADEASREGIMRFGAATQAVFNLTLSHPVGQDVLVDFSTFDVSDTADAFDYAPLVGSVVLGANEQSVQVLVDTLDDFEEEADEVFTLHVTAVTGATLDGPLPSAVATLIDDDSAPPPPPPPPPSSSNDIYVWDIEFDTRIRGKGGSRHDERILVTVNNDVDANGVDSNDMPAANVLVSVEITGPISTSFEGLTDGSGVFTSPWLLDVPDGSYVAEVTMLSHGTFVWNGALDPTANDIDWDGDGFPDEFHEVPHGATSQSQAYHFPVSPPTLLPALELNSNSSRKQLDTKRPTMQTVQKLDMHDQQQPSNQTALRSLSIDQQFEQSIEDGLIEESLLNDLAYQLAMLVEG